MINQQSEYLIKHRSSVPSLMLNFFCFKTLNVINPWILLLALLSSAYKYAYHVEESGKFRNFFPWYSVNMQWSGS